MSDVTYCCSSTITAISELGRVDCERTVERTMGRKLFKAGNTQNIITHANFVFHFYNHSPIC